MLREYLVLLLEVMVKFWVSKQWCYRRRVRVFNKQYSSVCLNKQANSLLIKSLKTRIKDDGFWQKKEVVFCKQIGKTKEVK